MCGRYELHAHPAAIALAFSLDLPPDISPRYNIAPMTDVPVVRVNADIITRSQYLEVGI